MLEFLTRHKTAMPSAEEALPGRDKAIVAPGDHFVLGTPMAPPFPDDTEQVILGMGCFWGAERAFWQLPGMFTTAVGYSGGHTANPTYEEVCSGRTGQNEVVLAVFKPAEISFEDVLRTFWEGHNPTQGMRQGNDAGTQYRSSLYTTTETQAQAAQASKVAYGNALSAAGHGGEITTEIAPSGSFYYAEEYHQQYLAKVPNGYCGMGGTGVSCPVGLTTT
ncbi:MAG: peptide-methionine (S)-S-oxide reductase MsrA [Thermoleophilaceae bacterium]